MVQAYHRDNWIQEKIDIISGQFVPNDVVSGWFLMDSFWPVGAMLGVYAFLGLKLGPGFTESRKPLKLKGFTLAYNFIQVMLNGWFVWLSLTFPGSFSHVQKHICRPLEKEDNPLYNAISYYGWYFFMSKVFDLLDTIFYISRKTKSQITFVLVLHHISAVFAAWIYLKYLSDIYIVLIGVLNAFARCCMNSYFFLAAFGPSVRKYLWWRKYITQLQLAQFVVGITLVTSLLWKGCLVSTTLAHYLLANLLLNLILFAKFYIESYQKRNQVRIETNINGSSVIEGKNNCNASRCSGSVTIHFLAILLELNASFQIGVFMELRGYCFLENYKHHRIFGKIAH